MSRIELRYMFCQVTVVWEFNAPRSELAPKMTFDVGSKIFLDNVINSGTTNYVSASTDSEESEDNEEWEECLIKPASIMKQITVATERTEFLRTSVELRLFDFDIQFFIIQASRVPITVSGQEYGQSWLQIVDTDKEWLQQPISADMHPVFNFEYLSFIFDHSEDSSAHSWLLRFRDLKDIIDYQECLTCLLRKQAHETQWTSQQKATNAAKGADAEQLKKATDAKAGLPIRQLALERSPGSGSGARGNVQNERAQATSTTLTEKQATPEQCTTASSAASSNTSVSSAASLNSCTTVWATCASSVGDTLANHDAEDLNDPSLCAEEIFEYSKNLELQTLPNALANHDAEDLNDPSLCAEYVEEIFEYYKVLELQTLPNAKYMDCQDGMDWEHRRTLIDWLIEVHSSFPLMPETLFLAVNIIDRFLSRKVVGLGKLQLVGATAMLIACKYEEVLSPKISNFVDVASESFTINEVETAERCILSTLKFDLSYPNPMNFLRRISKADDDNVQTHNLGKYLMEVSLVDHCFLEYKQSHIAAAAMYLARKILDRGPWNATLVQLAGYTEEEIIPVFNLMIKYLQGEVKEVKHQALFNKYAKKRFLKGKKPQCLPSWSRNR
jgi:hypothetical protein